MPAPYDHSLRFDADRRDGWKSCMCNCPTVAVRVCKGWAAKLEDPGIDCCKCVGICAHGTIFPLTDHMAGLSKSKRKVAIPSPVLYTEFDVDVFPGMVFATLKQSGSSTPSFRSN